MIRVAGVDEAGRGPLAGPVVAAAVILDPQRPIPGLRDSKVLSAAARERLAGEIRARASSWGIGFADATEIDTLNILQASLLAMRRALGALALAPGRILVDGNQCPSLAGLPFHCEVEAVVGGDATVAAISAASILAKTTRDAWMVEAARSYPGYGFDRHKGYPTPAHRQALATLGPCRLHRMSFAPVRSAHASR
ncbi:MAG: ribonuclease HII [Gammaproteobacteria bacterium]|nr:MAG: ribonuclease HII [Gammaproteobacteria bacterium]